MDKDTKNKVIVVSGFPSLSKLSGEPCEELSKGCSLDPMIANPLIEGIPRNREERREEVRKKRKKGNRK